MSHWGTPNTTVNRTCPLRRVVRVEVRDKGWATEHLDCGHSRPNYAMRCEVGKRRRCIECGKANAAQGEPTVRPTPASTVAPATITTYPELVEAIQAGHPMKVTTFGEGE